MRAGEAKVQQFTTDFIEKIDKVSERERS